jgi:hypothetical protein
VVFVVNEATNKRRNTGEVGWARIVDLVKAFDSSVPSGCMQYKENTAKFECILLIWR